MLHGVYEIICGQCTQLAMGNVQGLLSMDSEDQYVPVEALPTVKQSVEDKRIGYRYKCQMCPYCTTILSRFQDHIIDHNSTTSEHCQRCGKVFKNLVRLQAHLLTHDMLRPYTCMYCEKKFKRNYTLAKHMKLHLGAAERVKCVQCAKTFSTNATLKKHVCKFKACEEH